MRFAMPRVGPFVPGASFLPFGLGSSFLTTTSASIVAARLELDLIASRGGSPAGAGFSMYGAISVSFLGAEAPQPMTLFCHKLTTVRKPSKIRDGSWLTFFSHSPATPRLSMTRHRERPRRNEEASSRRESSSVISAHASGLEPSAGNQNTSLRADALCA